MAGEQSYFSNVIIVRGHHMYKHIWMPGIDEALSVEKEPPNLHDNFAISVVKNELYAGARSQHSTHPPAIIRELVFITVQDLWPPA